MAFANKDFQAHDRILGRESDWEEDMIRLTRAHHRGTVVALGTASLFFPCAYGKATVDPENDKGAE